MELTYTPCILLWDRKVDAAPINMVTVDDSCNAEGLMPMDLATEKHADHKEYH